MSKNALLALLLLSAVPACGSEDSAPSDESKDDADKGGDEDEGGDDEGGDEGGKMDGGKGRLDGSVVVKDGGSDGGGGGGGSKDDETKPDASVKPDAGKTDAGGGGGTTPKLKPKCMKKQSQGMIIGDSYINWITHAFPAQFNEVSGGGWRMEAVGAQSMGSGGVGFIPDQFTASIARDPDAHTILMDGGGNDILVADPSLDFFSECKTSGSPKIANCQKIVQLALDAADKLLLKASESGVRDVVYFFYPHVPKGTVLGGPDPLAILDYALPRVREFCESVEGKTNGKTRCHFLDTVPLFENQTDVFFPGDIHENEKGSKLIVDAVWKLMTDKCIGQPESSGCCEP